MITVVGAGAVGLTLGARLAQSGSEVVLVTRRPEAAEAIERNGVRVEDAASGEVVQVPVRAVAGVERAAEVFDLGAGPVLLAMGLDPVWLGIMIAINLQTSFLTPPFGFALFYLRGVAPPEVKTTAIYRGVLPFVAIQLLMLVLLAAWPALATWLPSKVYP